MKNQDKAMEWLRRAKSNLACAKIGRISPEILYEDLCFNTHQAVEKALKSLCIMHEIKFPKTHDIAYLFEILEKGNVPVPHGVKNARILNEYAVEARYPGDYEPIDEMDYSKALEIAKKVLKWVEKMIEEKS
ncbi:MAG: HEPN domain-containing protein [Candidatus Eremiobacteraeota bacterium]|nr:HEPN domain-containing protein [Candidatus Eremiobacteraeota bacterium]